ncbi:MAG: hypothetical protein KIT16_02670 [Rhodospirillaceae bacterium]|nr:hypothetical protein [Rhodospirillaceae bacterium]
MKDIALADFPMALRALIEAECAAGNAVIEIGHGFPAAPIAAFARLERPVATRPRTSAGELRFYQRNSSLWSGEWTDAQGYYFVLEPPVEPPPPPDPETLRRRTEFRPPSPEIPRFTVDVDVRGETLTYREPGREATVICTFGGDPCIVPRTLSGWWYPAERRSAAMTDEEKERLIVRIADHCRGRLGMARLAIES